jgi:hypothetical protein
MKYLADQPHKHNYVFLKQKTDVTTEPYLKIIPKNIYVCVECGLAMSVYELDNFIEVNRNE